MAPKVLVEGYTPKGKTVTVSRGDQPGKSSVEPPKPPKAVSAIQTPKKAS